MTDLEIAARVTTGLWDDPAYETKVKRNIGSRIRSIEVTLLKDNLPVMQKYVTFAVWANHLTNAILPVKKMVPQKV